MLKEDPTCFIAGTLIRTKEGLVPIERVKVGDYVLSKPEGQGTRSEAGGLEYKRVVKTYSAEAKEVYYIDFFPEDADLSSEEGRDEVVVTGSHPIWVEGRGWMRVEQLKQHGTHTVQLADGRMATLRFAAPLYRTDTEGLGWFQFLREDIGHLVDLRGGQISLDPDSSENSDVDWLEGEGRLRRTVYNLEVEDFHTFYVGRLGLWVHNNTVTGDINR